MIIFAQSLGGNIAMNTLLDKSLRKKVNLLVLDSTFLSYQEIARDKMANFFITWPFQHLAFLLVSHKGDMRNRIGKLSPLPILIIHGTGDSVVPFKFGSEIFNKAKEPKNFWKIETHRHCAVFFVERGRYRKKFLEFIENIRSQD